MKLQLIFLAVCLVGFPGFAFLAKTAMDRADDLPLYGSWNEVLGMCIFMFGIGCFMLALAAMAGIPLAILGLIFG